MSLKTKIVKGILSIIGLAVISFGTIILELIAIINCPNVKILNLFQIGIPILGLIISILYLYLIWPKNKNKKIIICLITTIGLILLINIGFITYLKYDNNIPKVETTDLLYSYLPYVPYSNVVKLSEESTFKIDNEYPLLDGATALYPIYTSFANAVYSEDVLTSENFNKYVQCSTTKQAYQNIIDGTVDMIFVAGPSEEQKKSAEEAGVELIYTPIGKEAFVFFVNSKNSINNISIENIQNIYSGKITKWSELGVKKLGDIKAFQRDKGSGSQSSLEHLMGDIPIKEPLTEEINTFMEGIITKTADYKNYKNAIGYSFRFYSTRMVTNDYIKLLNINGIAPSVENIKNETYPITSNFYVVTRSNSSKTIKEFIDWILREQGQEIIEKVGYVGIN